MKVLQVLPTLSAGGAETFVANLCVSLAGLGIDVKLFLLAGARGERGKFLLSRLQNAGIEVVGFNERNIRSFDTVLRLANLICEWKPNLIQANLFSAEFVTVLSKFLSMRNNVHILTRKAGTRLIGHRSKIIVKLINRCFSHTVCCSDAVRSAYIDLVGLNFEDKCCTIVNGVYAPGLDTCQSSRGQFRLVTGIPTDAFVFCHVGRMMGNGLGTGLETEPKAQDVILKSFCRAFKGQDSKHLMLVGGGRLLPEAQSLAKSLGITSQVHFLGFQAESWPALNAADAFFFPSRHEGMPNALIEAAICGLPALATDIPEIRSIFPGDAWLLKTVDDVNAFADGLYTIFENFNLFSNRARAVASSIRNRFSMNTCAEQYITVYQGILNKVK